MTSLFIKKQMTNANVSTHTIPDTIMRNIDHRKRNRHRRIKELLHRFYFGTWLCQCPLGLRLRWCLAVDVNEWTNKWIYFSRNATYNNATYTGPGQQGRMQPPLTAACKKIKNKKSTLILAPNDRCKPKKSSHDESVPIQNLTQNSTNVRAVGKILIK